MTFPLPQGVPGAVRPPAQPTHPARPVQVSGGTVLLWPQVRHPTLSVVSTTWSSSFLGLTPHPALSNSGPRMFESPGYWICYCQYPRQVGPWAGEGYPNCQEGPAHIRTRVYGLAALFHRDLQPGAGKALNILLQLMQTCWAVPGALCTIV